MSLPLLNPSSLLSLFPVPLFFALLIVWKTRPEIDFREGAQAHMIATFASATVAT